MNKFALISVAAVLLCSCGPDLTASAPPPDTETTPPYVKPVDTGNWKPCLYKSDAAGCMGSVLPPNP